MSGIRGERDRRDGEHGREMCGRAVGFRDRTRTIDESRPARVVHPFVRFGAARRRMRFRDGRDFFHAFKPFFSRCSRFRGGPAPRAQGTRARSFIGFSLLRVIFCQVGGWQSGGRGSRERVPSARRFKLQRLFASSELFYPTSRNSVRRLHHHRLLTGETSRVVSVCCCRCCGCCFGCCYGCGWAP